MWRGLMAAGAVLLVAASLGCGPVDRAAKGELLGDVGSLEVTVYPAFVRQRGQPGRWDAHSAATIAAEIQRLGLGTATAGAEEVPIGGEWHARQPKMLEESARAFAAHLQRHPPPTRYALLPEFMFGQGGHAARIHGYVVDASGRIALVILTNSKWEGFDQERFTSPEACARYLTERLEVELRR